MVNSICYRKDDRTITHPQILDFQDILKKPNYMLWVDIWNDDVGEVSKILSNIFRFHPLSVEDCISSGYQSPKVDLFRDYIFIIVHAITKQGLGSNIITSELDLYIGDNFLVTCHSEPNMEPVEKVKKLIYKDDRILFSGPDGVCHSILDNMIDDYMPVIDQMDNELDSLEDRVLDDPQPPILDSLLRLKHDIMDIRRIVSPQREVMNNLSRDPNAFIKDEMRIYFRDIYDHLVRIQDLTESLRDILTGVLDIYLNSTSVKLNSIMKALTIVSTIFLPLSFVAGVFGMNFLYMPEITWKYGYAMSWVLFLLISSAMIYFFKKKKWF